MGSCQYGALAEGWDRLDLSGTTPPALKANCCSCCSSLPPRHAHIKIEPSRVMITYITSLPSPSPPSTPQGVQYTLRVTTTRYRYLAYPLVRQWIREAADSFELLAA